MRRWEEWKEDEEYKMVIKHYERRRCEFKLAQDMENQMAKSKELEDKISNSKNKIDSLQEFIYTMEGNKGSVGLQPIFSYGSFGYDLNLNFEEKMQEVDQNAVPGGQIISISILSFVIYFS